MSEGTPGGEWMTVNQAAEYFGVHVNTVRAWLDEHKLNGWRTPAGTRRIWKDAKAKRLKRDRERGA